MKAACESCQAHTSSKATKLSPNLLEDTAMAMTEDQSSRTLQKRLDFEIQKKSVPIRINFAIKIISI